MKDMNEVVTAKIQAKLQKGRENAVQATARLQAEGKIAVDYLFDVGAEKKGKSSNITFLPDLYPNKIGAELILPELQNDGHTRFVPKNFTINMHAVRQVAAKLNIPATYLIDLLQGDGWQKKLGYEILNTHNGWTDRNKMLLRTVGTDVRAFLSDSYRRLDSEMIFGTHIDELMSNGAQLADGYMDDTRFMVESLLPHPIEVHTELNGIIFLAFGVRMDSSDYGAKALDLRQFIMQGVCLNGMVRQSVLRQVHLGSKLPDNLSLSAETYKLDSMTTASAVRDLTKNLYSTEAIKDRMIEVKAASTEIVSADAVLTNLFKTGKLFKGETEEVGKLLMRNDPMTGIQGESTLWKLTQGITAYANNDSVDMIRRMELQEVAGDLFNKLKN